MTCEHCGGLAALFQDGGTWPGLIEAGCCPYHHHVAGVPFGGDRQCVTTPRNVLTV